MARIVTDASVFEPGFLPDEIPHRRQQLEVLANAVAPLPGDSESAVPVPAPTVLSGPTGTGKTCTVQYAIRKLSAREGLAIQHVGCGETEGRFDVLCRLLSGADLPTYDLHPGSTPHARLMDRLAAGLSARYVVVLDDVDRLADRDLLYGLNRLHEVSLVLVSTQPEELFAALDPRLRSRLAAGVHICFDPYEEVALRDILRQRLDRGLAAGAVTEDRLGEIATAAEGDAGWAIRTLRTAVRLAHQTDADTIGAEIIGRAIRRTVPAAPRQHVADLPPDQQVLYEVVAAADGITPAELYEQYRQRVAEPKTRRTVRTYIAELVEDGFVRAEGQTRRRRYVPAGGQ